MSTSSSPLSPYTPYHDDSRSSAISPPPLSYIVTRTVAIIKTHALSHRFEIERRIQEAHFEV
jgi:hypothetical protein